MPCLIFARQCTFEQANAKLVVAHLARAERLAARRSQTLSTRFANAQASRAKLTDISDGQVRRVAVDDAPVTVLEAAFADIDGATFVGRGDRPKVQFMLAELEWIMKTAMEQVMAAPPVRSGASGSMTTASPYQRARSALRRTLCRLGLRRTEGSLSLRSGTLSDASVEASGLALRPIFRGNPLNGILSMVESPLVQSSSTRRDTATCGLEEQRSSPRSPCRYERSSSRSSRRYEELPDGQELTAVPSAVGV